MTGNRGPRAETEEPIACRGTIARCSRTIASSVTGMRAAVFLYSVGTREAQRSRRLSHPNIVRIHDVFHTPGELGFIAMEYVEGLPLLELRRHHYVAAP